MIQQRFRLIAGFISRERKRERDFSLHFPRVFPLMKDVSPESAISSIRNAWVNHSTHDRESKQGSFSGNLRPLSLQATTWRDETIVLANPQTFSPFVCGYDNTGAIQTTARSLNAMTRRDPGENSNLRPRPTIYVASPLVNSDCENA